MTLVDNLLTRNSRCRFWLLVGPCYSLSHFFTVLCFFLIYLVCRRFAFFKYFFLLIYYHVHLSTYEWISTLQYNIETKLRSLLNENMLLVSQVEYTASIQCSTKESTPETQATLSRRQQDNKTTETQATLSRRPTRQQNNTKHRILKSSAISTYQIRIITMMGMFFFSSRHWCEQNKFWLMIYINLSIHILINVPSHFSQL